MDLFGIIILCVVIFILLIIFLYLVPVGLWFQALVSGVHTSLIQLMFMRFRKVPPSVIVNNMINATKAGLKLSQNELEAHYLARKTSWRPTILPVAMSPTWCRPLSRRAKRI